MPTKEELVEQAKDQGIDPDGLTKAELEEALAGGNGQGMDGQSEPYYPQQRRHENQ